MSVIPIHPELVDVATVRWVLPGREIPGRGEVVVAPEPLASLVRDGVIVRAAAEPDGILITLRAGESWRQWTEPVRAALLGALETGGWDFAGGDSLAEALDAVLAGEAGDFIRSHGGDADVVAVDGDDATLRFSGTCAFCPALGITLTARIESAVRERYPALGKLHTERASRGLWPR